MSFGPSSGPDMDIFRHFHSSWNFTDQSKFEPLVPGDLDSQLADVFFSATRNRLCYSVSGTWNLPNLVMTTANFLSWSSLFLVVVLQEDSDLFSHALCTVPDGWHA